MTSDRAQRIRDPVHNLIEFGASADDDQRQLEHVLWRAIQTRPFQRLRRIKQLGFSELVFPGATHTRFAHSLGVFHTARLLVAAIRRRISEGHRNLDSALARVALAAALLHDVGHGMFSHAFESVGKTLKIPLARHEAVSDRLIRDSEITPILKELGSGFANDVADLIGREQPRTLYDAVVTSQFDADRLDYMQRDRLMTGVHSGSVDVTWLLNNLYVAEVDVSADNERIGTIETLVLGPKAFHVAESYVLELFHLYPNVYFHKATRGAEQLFRALVLRIFALVQDGRPDVIGLPTNHPLMRFVASPGELDHVLELDDAVLLGALSMLKRAEDSVIRLRAAQLLDRRLLECFDVWVAASELLPPPRSEEVSARAERIARINLACDRVVQRLASECPSVLVDDYRRDPYKRFQDSRTPPNQIHILQAGQVRDMAELSSVVRSAEPFRVCRGYFERGDTVTAGMLRNIVRTSIEGETSADL